MIKHIAVGLDGTPCGAAAESLAIALAQRLGATVHGIHVIDSTFIDGALITDISGSMGIEPFLNLQAQAVRTLQEIGEAIRSRFVQQCQAAGVQSDFRMERSTLVHGILGAAKLSDVLVVGQRGASSRTSDNALGSTTSVLLRRSSAPVVVVPEGAKVPSRLLAAYDGSAKSVAALHHAAELARALGCPLTVVGVDEKEDRARARLDEAATYLAPYGIEAERRLERGEAVEQVLLGLLQSGEFDLIFLGAHGHGRIVELVLGSTTEYLASRAPVPLFCVTHL